MAAGREQFLQGGEHNSFFTFRLVLFFQPPTLITSVEILKKLMTVNYRRKMSSG